MLLAVAPAFALEVEQVRWGFDGQVVPGRFNLLSVLVANPSADPFDGTVNFYKRRGMADRVGAVYSTPCYLSPLTTRWLQFYVFIENQYDQWQLEWGRGARERQDLDAPKWGAPAQVLLSDSETALGAASAFKQFPDELFPPTVAATSGLDMLLLDHAPHWEPAKRQAFLDWLRAGGKVHLLTGSDGHLPVFPDELSVLNTSQDRARIGAGLVVRHAATAREIRTQDVQDGNVPPREFKLDASAMPEQTTDSFFRVLARFSQRHYNWAGMYLLAILYVALAGPGNLAAGRKLADYRLRIGLLLATITGFALLFNFVGRRGEGETSVVHSLSYARAIDGDTYDVLQWVNVFAARGALYTITHPAPHNLYATGQDYESVNGRIVNGKDGRFVVDIPMFSRRAFVHEAEMKGVNIPVKIVSWDGTNTLNKLVVTVGPDFTKRVLEGWVVQGDQIFAMTPKISSVTMPGVPGSKTYATSPTLEFEDSNKQSLETFITEASGSHLFQLAYDQPQGNKTPNVEIQFRELVKPLLAWSLGAGYFKPPNKSSSAANDRVQLFLFARSPESFCVAGSKLGHEVGYVLYHFDLFKPVL